LKEIHPKITPLQEYDRSQIHIKHKCLECDNEWKVQPNALLQQKYGCPVCAAKIRGLTARRTHEEYVKLLAEANPNVIALEEYQRADVHIMHKCLTCNNEWKTIPNCLIGLKSGCPKCNRVGFREQWAREVLEEVFDLPFPTCKPKWLKYKGQMEIDCYNEDLRLAVEYQGEQHYEPLRYFGGEEKFLIRLQRDRTKYNLINEKKIIFWRFDNRKYKKLLEKEFKLAIKEEIRKNALSEHQTPDWKPSSKKIREFFEN
jgi:predicted  nucleic acid-binding Zn-ribbon protein